MTEVRTQKIVRLGIDVENLSELNFVTGIQRVATETNRSLFSLASRNFKYRGVITNSIEQSKNFETNSYLAEDPILSNDLASLEELDVFLSLDHNWKIDFDKIRLAKQEKDLLAIFLVHDVIPLHFPEFFAIPNAKRMFQVYLQKIFQVADVLIVTSEKVRNDIVDLNWTFNGEIKVVPLGAFEIYPYARFHNSEFNLLYVATLEPRKGHLDLLDAFDILREQGHSPNLNIVGRRGWLDEEIYSRITNHEAFGGRLRWFSGISDNELAALYESTNLVVMPTQEEGFGLGLEEAIANQRKVLVRRINVFLERAQDNVYFFEGDPKDLAAAIEKVCKMDWVTGSKPVRTIKSFAEEIHDLIVNKLKI